MKEQLEKLEKKIDTLTNVVNKHLVVTEQRLLPLETKVKIGCWIVMIVVGGLITLGLKGCC